MECHDVDVGAEAEIFLFTQLLGEQGPALLDVPGYCVTVPVTGSHRDRSERIEILLKVLGLWTTLWLETASARHLRPVRSLAALARTDSEIVSKVNVELVKWQPELSPEARKHIERPHAELEPRIALMRELRKTLGLTQVEVAQLLGVTQSNISKIEVRGDPSLSILARMAEAKGRRLRLAVETPDGKEEASLALG